MNAFMECALRQSAAKLHFVSCLVAFKLINASYWNCLKTANKNNGTGWPAKRPGHSDLRPFNNKQHSKNIVSMKDVLFVMNKNPFSITSVSAS